MQKIARITKESSDVEEVEDLCKDLDSVIGLPKGNKLKKKHSDQL